MEVSEEVGMLAGISNSPTAVRRLKALSAVAGVVLVLYWAAVIAGVPSAVLSVVFTATVPVFLGLVWWAAVRAARDMRLFVVLAAVAVTFQAVGTGLWYVAFVRNGGVVPEPPGYWTPFLHIALGLGIVVAWAGVRDAVRIREAGLDYSIVLVAAACLVVAAIGQQLETGLSTAASLDAAFRPVAGVLTVTVVISAGLGRWRALPLAVGLFAVAQTFSALGDVLFGFLAAEGAYADNRWTGALWFSGVMIAMVAAATVILGVDRPIRLTREALPAVSPRELMMAAVGAWACAAVVTLYGALADHPAALYAGIAASAWIGLAVPLRTLMALEESRAAYRRLDEAHLELEVAADTAAGLARERDETIEELARRNVEHSAVHAMLGPLLELADERSDGQLRARLEETAEDLTEWLPHRDG